jgi:pilus assembly protein FimV
MRPVAQAPAPAAAAPATDASERTQAILVPGAEMPAPGLDLDFGAEPASAVATPAQTPEPVRLDAPDLTLNEGALSFDLDAAPPAAAPQPAPQPAPVPQAAAPAPAAAAAGDGMIEFDLGALSLDLPGKKEAAAAPAAAAAADDTDNAPLSTAGLEDPGGDPLATKLALAEEFNAIGDPDGARSLAEEVLAEASGELKSRAQKLLAEIG